MHNTDRRKLQNPRQRRSRHGERGVAMVVALGITMVILVVGIAMMSMSTSELVATKSQGDTITLRNLAESGVERAMARLNSDPTWRCTNPNDASFNNAPVVARVNGADTTLGTYTVDQVNELGGDYIQVTARGYYPNATAAQKQVKQVRLTAYKKWGTPFSAAAFGRDGVPLANGGTDSFNSKNGNYSPLTAGTQGDIRTDSTDPNAISIYNNGTCAGKVIYGPGTNLDAIKLDTSRIRDGDANETNDVLVAPNTAVMPNIAIPSTAQPISTVTGRADNILSGNVVIPAGTYYCDKIAITGSETVYTTGKVTLYVTGSVSIGGNGIVNNFDHGGGSAKAENLLIYGTTTCTSVSISGNGGLTAAVYAPQADITLNGGGNNEPNSGVVYGSLAGKTVSFNGNGTVLHYDTALQSLKGVVVGFRTKTWEEDY